MVDQQFNYKKFGMTFLDKDNFCFFICNFWLKFCDETVDY